MNRARMACLLGVAAGWAALAALAAPVAAGENWPQWRGPALNGSSTETGLPGKFSTTENVAWVADVPGMGGGSPVVWDDHVFLAAQDANAGHKLWAISLNRADGKLRWKHPMGTGLANKMGNTGASASPVTDGKTVWFFYTQAVLTAFDMDGKQLWQRDIPKDHGKIEVLWDYGSSPLLYKGRLYVNVIQGSHTTPTPADAFLLCLDPATGKDLWKHVRPTDAIGESRQAYSTPYAFEAPGGTQIVLTGGDHLTGHSAVDGHELWRSASYNRGKDHWWRTVPSVVACGDIAIGCAPKGGPLFGVRTVDGPGDAKAGSEAWTTRYNSPDVCTPLVYDGKLFVLDGDKKQLVNMDGATGKVNWKGDLPGKANFQASASGADGKIYCIDQAGEVFVVSAGEKFEVLHKAEMGGAGCRSTIAIAGGQLFIRTADKLYCVGKRNR
jgi:outer membrane protein assembly factor BamB